MVSMSGRALVSLLLVLASGGFVSLPAHAEEVPRPVLNVNFPDPAVTTTRDGLVAYSTGELVPHAWAPSPRGTWQHGAGVLIRLPDWAAPGRIWAVDVARIRGRWLLYYSVRVNGLGKDGRCIAVARGRSARGPFRPLGDRPLVCPRGADTPRALDPVLPRPRGLPQAGVIDPSVHVDARGRVHLLYKTDQVPSSIRIVRLTRWGTRPVRRSVEVMRFDGVIENPVLTRRPEGWVMLLSKGDWTKCTYRTMWTRSTDLFDWSDAVSGPLVNRRRTGLCGAGGADLVRMPGGDRIFLHAWTCHGTDQPCRGRSRWTQRPRAQAIRSMYAARLAWRNGRPVMRRWITPR